MCLLKLTAAAALLGERGRRCGHALSLAPAHAPHGEQEEHDKDQKDEEDQDTQRKGNGRNAEERLRKAACASGCASSASRFGTGRRWVFSTTCGSCRRRSGSSVSRLSSSGLSSASCSGAGNWKTTRSAARRWLWRCWYRASSASPSSEDDERAQRQTERQNAREQRWLVR